MAKEKFKRGKPDGPCIVCGNPNSLYHHLYGRNTKPELINADINLMILCDWHHNPTSKVSVHKLGLSDFIRMNALDYYMIEKGWEYDEYDDCWFIPKRNLTTK